ncbi:hypothetical protein SLEP1_g3717 [Rubroshorea leprosula]|uniref:Uncharacterized protein n=1 Tax=Rubroshorea leprosula TaxID=152421 RepID=A0AAV5HVN9_9ROSI|nr:hypothetical protein SLEP1_g3717 [Rubroshorea leprosula]
MNFLHFPSASPSHNSGSCWIYGNETEDGETTGSDELEG